MAEKVKIKPKKVKSKVLTLKLRKQRNLQCLQILSAISTSPTSTAMKPVDDWMGWSVAMGAYGSAVSTAPK